MGTLSWRDMTERDIDFVKGLESDGDNAAFVFQWTQWHYRNALNDPDLRLWVLEKAGLPCGYCILAGFEDRDEILELRRIVVKPKLLGIGRRALEGLLREVFTGLGKERLWLDYFGDNAVAAHLFTDLGFSDEGRLCQAVVIGHEAMDVVVMGMMRDEYEARNYSQAPPTHV